MGRFWGDCNYLFDLLQCNSTEYLEIDIREKFSRKNRISQNFLCSRFITFNYHDGSTIDPQCGKRNKLLIESNLQKLGTTDV